MRSGEGSGMWSTFGDKIITCVLFTFKTNSLMRIITMFLGICLTVLTFSSLQAQKLIALHHEGAVSYFTELSAAYNSSVSGDTLYLPGGSFGGLSLQKSLTLIGVGHHPDSTAATGATILSYLHLYSSASNSLITGIYFISSIESYESLSNITISRCYLNQGIYLGNGEKSNWIISENWIGVYPYPNGSYSIWLQSGSASNFFVSNNVIRRIIAVSYSAISNNIFLDNAFVSTTNSIISNNIFSTNYQNQAGSSQWFNNVNSGINGGPNISGNTGSSNYLDNLALESIFVNYSPSNTFYQNDFHVVNSAYLGNDGMPVGIYGGAFPWKDGSLPFTPHIRSKTIGATTNPDGTLNINITVKAQGN